MPGTKSALSERSESKGFTLVEFLVAITIGGILATIGIINYRTFSSTQILNSAVSDVQSILRQSQSNATGAVRCSGTGSTEWLTVFTNSTNIELKCKTAPTSSETLVKTLTLPAEVRINTITGAPTCTWGFPATISFATLSGKITFPGASPTCTSFIVPVEYISQGFIKTITVTLGGSIDAQN